MYLLTDAPRRQIPRISDLVNDMKKLAELNITTDRLRLIPLKLSDAEKLHELSNHREITDKVDILSTPFTVNDAKKLLSYESDRDECFFGISLKEDSTFVAVMGAHLYGGKSIEIGYWVHPGHKRRGFVSEALNHLTASLHHHYPDCIIMAECRPENIPSFSLLKKCGFIPTGKPGNRPGRQILIWQE